jgi:cyclic beta-1,2-glucan synthetase
MAHHQAMIIAALANVLCDDSLVRRLHANPEIAAVEYLLFEALPKRAADRVIWRMPPVRPRVMPLMSSEMVRIDSARRERFVNVIGNGHLTVRATACGGGDLTWNGIAITRWWPRSLGPCRGDQTYLSDLDAGTLHVLGDATAPGVSDSEAWCAPHGMEMHQRIDTLFVRTATGVAPNNDVAFKRVTLTNESNTVRRVMVTHYAQFVLASAGADQRHPAFNKLFIESEYVRGHSALVFGRRRRSGVEASLSCAVSAVMPDEFDPVLEFTCDRRAFFGRAGRYDRPAALAAHELALDATVGSGFDPAVALGIRLTLPPGATAQVTFVTAVASERHQALELIGHFRSHDRIHFTLDQARHQAAAELTELSLDSESIAQLLEIYSDLVWPRPLTPWAAADAGGTDSVLGALWSRGISGDFPICMARVIRRAKNTAVERLLALQAYLDRRGMPIDVVLIDESPASYSDSARQTMPWTFYSTIGSSTRTWQDAFGHVQASTSPLAGLAFVINCRTRSRSCMCGQTFRERRSFAPVPCSLPKETCCTGGTRHRRAACVHDVPTTSCGCRSRSASTSLQRATPTCLTKSCRTLRANLLVLMKRSVIPSTRQANEMRAFTNTANRRSTRGRRRG